MVTTKHKPVLIVIAGPNGSGKTTITTQILRHEWMEDAVYVNPDQVAQERFGDWNSNEAVMQAAQYCEEQREQCLRDGQSLIFETVLSSLRRRFRPLANGSGRSDVQILERRIYAYSQA